VTKGRTVILAALLLGACGDDDGTGPVDAMTGAGDGGSSYGPDDVVPDAPAPPGPVAWDCPSGWRSVDVGGAQACDPWPETGYETCAGAEAHLPGTGGCAPIGPPCPTSGFAIDLPADRPIVYVDASAAGGGDGTSAAPHTTIADAMTDLAAGSVVAVAMGTYDEVVRPPSGIALWGACAASTIVTPSELAESSGAVSIDGELEVRNLTVSGDRPGVVVIGGRAQLGAVMLDGNLVAGLFVGSGGTVTGSDVVIRNTRSRSDGRIGRGISVDGGATLDLARLLLWRNAEAGLVALEPSTQVTLTDFAVIDSQPRAADGWFGRGLVAQEAARIDARRGALEDNGHDCIFTSGVGTEVSLVDAVVRGTRANDTGGYFGSGATAFTGASIDVRGALLSDNVTFALGATGSGSAVRATDVVVVDGRPVPDGRAGFGMQLRDAAIGEVTRGHFARNGQAQLVVLEDAALTATDVVVRDGEPVEASGEDGRGIAVSARAALTLSRAQVIDNHEAGVMFMTGGRGTLSDVRIEGTRLEFALTGDQQGRGLDLLSGSTVTGERVELVGNREGAVLVDGAGSSLVLSHARVVGPTVDQVPAVAGRIYGAGIGVQFDGAVALSTVLIEDALYAGLLVSRAGATADVDRVMVRRTEPMADGFWGHGVQVQRGGLLRGTALAVEEATAFGLLASQLATSVEVTDLRVERTRSRPCAEAEDCAAAGIGVSAAVGGRVSLTEFSIADNALCGIQVVDAEADLAHGVIARHPIGANVQSTDFDFGRLTNGVDFVDNERNVDAALLPIPDETAAYSASE
jgi:hypothetical protein